MSSLPDAAVPDLCARLALALTSLAGYADFADQPRSEVIESSPQAAKCRHVRVDEEALQIQGANIGF